MNSSVFTTALQSALRESQEQETVSVRIPFILSGPASHMLETPRDAAALKGKMHIEEVSVMPYVAKCLKPVFHQSANIY